MTDTTPTTSFAYAVAGEAAAGTLADYARDYANAHYCGEDISESGRWVDADGEFRPLTIDKVATGYNSDDYMVVTFTAEFPGGIEQISVTIDGRA